MLNLLKNSLNWRNKNKEKDGFFDLPKEQICCDPAHNFPSLLMIPPGKGYRHICKSCGKVTVVINPVIC